MKSGSLDPSNPKRPPIERILRPFNRFVHMEASSGVLLLLCTIVALIWANSPLADYYQALWHSKFTIGFGSFTLSKPLELWVNDGLMAIFFFVVGLEIKREVMVGELASPRQAALPIGAAVGGMVVPALIYFLLNPAEPAVRGWGVPMATDIAFSLGVLGLVGRGVPLAAKVFLTAFAIVDDIGAALVIAVFYTDQISFVSLGIGLLVLLLMVVANRLGIRGPLPYSILGFCLWVAFLKSGVHPTIAGILAAFTIPSCPRIDARGFLDRARQMLARFEDEGLAEQSVMTSSDQRGVLQALESASEKAQTPLHRLEHSLHPWVAFLIMPIFALANTGVSLNSDSADSLFGSLSLGIILGLVAGKQIGITLFAWLAVKLRIADLHGALTWKLIFGLSWLGGIGFTMSLFIANLAFSDQQLLASAKIGILAASLVAGIGGWLILKRAVGR